MKRDQLAAIVALCLVGMQATDLVRTAVLTRYDGLIDIQIHPNGGHLRIGRENPDEK